MGVHLTAVYTQFTISFFIIFFFLLDKLTHPTGIPTVLEVNRQHNSINPQHKTTAKEYDEVSLCVSVEHPCSPFHIVAKVVVGYPHVNFIQTKGQAYNAYKQ